MCAENWQKVIDIHTEPTSEFTIHRNIKQALQTHKKSKTHTKCLEAKLNNN